LNNDQEPSKKGNFLTIAEIFSLIESSKEALKIETYSLSQTTLESVFLSFARKQVDIGAVYGANNLRMPYVPNNNMIAAYQNNMAMGNQINFMQIQQPIYQPQFQQPYQVQSPPSYQLQIQQQPYNAPSQTPQQLPPPNNKANINYQNPNFR
jgi:hypothetical protein